jgi:hypothetical protein
MEDPENHEGKYTNTEKVLDALVFALIVLVVSLFLSLDL